MKIAYIGAGSLCFGPLIVKDILLSDLICKENPEVVLMDIVADNLIHVREKAEVLNGKLDRKVNISTTTNLEEALIGADFVICAIEKERYFYWTQDYQVPRKYGFNQIYGENGGPGSVFHALRNIQPIVHIAQTMEKLCPEAWLLNFSNPEHKVCEAVNRLTSIKSIGLCHGVFEGISQISELLEKPKEELDTLACGINHFTWFQKIADKTSGVDLYPALKVAESQGHVLAKWHEFGLGRVLFNQFGLWPSPATNHYGEYIRWADEFIANEIHYYNDPIKGQPWETGEIPEFVYTIDLVDTHRKWNSGNVDVFEEQYQKAFDSPDPSGECAIPIIEGLYFGVEKFIPAVNVVNNGKIPNLPADMVVEVPAMIQNGKLEAIQMQELPEPIAAICRTQGSIHKLTVEAFAEKSKTKLLHALLLEPTVNSYRQCVLMMNEMLDLQKAILPELK